MFVFKAPNGLGSTLFVRTFNFPVPLQSPLVISSDAVSSPGPDTGGVAIIRLLLWLQNSEISYQAQFSGNQRQPVVILGKKSIV